MKSIRFPIPATTVPARSGWFAQADVSILLTMPFTVFLSVIGLVFFEQDEPRPHYSGACGGDTSLKPYDDLTQQEHDEQGAFAGWISYGKGVGE